MALALVVVVALALRHELAALRVGDVVEAARATPGWRLLAAVALSALAYLALTGYDALALLYVRHPLPLHRIAFGSFVSYGLSQTLGFPLLTGGSVRYRLWSSWGVNAEQIFRAVAFVGIMFTMGATAVGGIALVADPAAHARTGLPAGAVRMVGAVLLATTLVYLAACALRHHVPIRIGRWEIRVPPPGLALGHLGLALVDWALAAGVLYVLLPSGSGPGYTALVGIFLVAQVAGLVSHVPGGLGVFDSIMLLHLQTFMPVPTVLGALVTYRVVYYLIPFLVALALLAGRELVAHRARLRRWLAAVADLARRAAFRVLPQVLATITFVAGAVLLLSGATPGVHSRLRWIGTLLPLTVIELSHFAASLVGAALLVLARGLARRLDAAWGTTVALLALGVVASLLKGLDYEEATVLLAALVLVAPARRAFYRTASLTGEPWGVGWTGAVLVVLAATAYFGLLAYRHVDYADELWWRFVLHGNASRSLRAGAGAIALLSFLTLLHLYRYAPVRPPRPGPAELDRVRAILAGPADLTGNLALLGDKALLFSASGRAFLMYGVAGRSWVSMGDPIGAADDHADLVWQFRLLADRQGGRTVFYEVGPRNLPLYIDLGLRLVKIGEEASVPLPGFSLDTSARKGLRRNARLMERAGVGFEVVEASQLEALLPELRAISEQWLRAKATREKGFSLGRFEESYLREFPVALVRDAHRVLAFANLWLGSDREAMSVDLMRYRPDAPDGVMTYFFIQLMLWGRARGFGRFVLGMAPMSGLTRRPLAPLWPRLGALVFEHGERFYNFRGVRAYKDKFHPVWEPRYLAYHGGLALPRILADIASLVGGGLAGVVSR